MLLDISYLTTTAYIEADSATIRFAISNSEQ